MWNTNAALVFSGLAKISKKSEKERLLIRIQEEKPNNKEFKFTWIDPSVDIIASIKQIQNIMR